MNKIEAHHSFTVMPKDCNFNRDGLNQNGILFGGKLMYEIDYAGAKVARRATYGVDKDMLVTASIDKIDFQRPAFVGDIVTMLATIKALGRTSIQIRVKVTREDLKGKVEQICSANMVFVTMKNGKSTPHDLNFEKLEQETNESQ
jgi:acyl-CoA hydrolase